MDLKGGFMKIFSKAISGIKKYFGNEESAYTGFFKSSSVLTAHAEQYKSYAYACINARAENIAKAKFYLYRQNGKDRTEIKSHPFLELIKHPNRKKQSFRELLHRISTSLDLYGNSYIYVSRNSDKEPNGLYFLPSPFVSIGLNSSSTAIEFYEYYASGEPVRYKADDIIHFLIPDPNSNIKGKSVTSGFNFTLEIDYLQNLYQKNIYENDAAPGIIIETDKAVNDASYERLKNKFESGYSGPGNAGRALILEEGMKAKPYAFVPKDTEIIPSRRLMRDEIMALFRVPKTILGIAEDVNRATAREQLKTFNDYVIKPFAKICIESKLNLFISSNYEKDIELVMEYEFEVDRETQLKALEFYAKYGIADRNEIREMEGF